MGDIISRPKQHVNARLDKELVEYVDNHFDGNGFSSKLRTVIIEHKQVLGNKNNLIITTGGVGNITGNHKIVHVDEDKVNGFRIVPEIKKE